MKNLMYPDLQKPLENRVMEVISLSETFKGDPREQVPQFLG